MNPGAGDWVYASIPETPGGVPLGVTTDCKLEWDLTGYTPGDTPKYAISMLIQNPLGVVVPLDFIVEISSVPSAPLTCDAVGDVAFTAQIGAVIHADFLVAGGPSGAVVGDVTTVLAGPSGATLMSKFPSTNPLPEEFHFHFVVPTDSSGILQWVLQFKLGAQICSQGVSVMVSS